MSDGAASGQLQVARFDEHVEVSVTSPQLDKTRVYAYGLKDPIKDFCEELGRDLAGGANAPAVQVMAASGALVSPTTPHSFAWKPGRTVLVGGDRLAVLPMGGSAAQQPRRDEGSARNSTSRRATRYVVVTGGVVSGLGKGVTASSLGVLLKAAGYRVTSIKVGARAPAPPPRQANCLRTLMETCIRRSTRT